MPSCWNGSIAERRLGEPQREKGRLYQVKQRGWREERELARRLREWPAARSEPAAPRRMVCRRKERRRRQAKQLDAHVHMRDIAVTAVVFGLLPFILWRPHIGILVWTWLGLMNPHRLCLHVRV